jgi:NTE family protein
MDRLNEITFNASVVLEINAIEAINSVLAELAASGVRYDGRYKPIRLHAIRNDAFVEQLGFVSKSSTSWEFLTRLHDVGHHTAEVWLRNHLAAIGVKSSLDVKAELTHKVLRPAVQARHP